MAIKILIHATPIQQQQWLLKPTDNEVEISFFEDKVVDADLYIDNIFLNELSVFNTIVNKPVLVNSINLIKLPKNFIFFNGWITSIANNALECSCESDDFIAHLKLICSKTNWQLFLFKNVFGLPTQRTIAMIINEAYFALEANVSSKQDIDIAMKLGTNYPHGPFEWCEKIGIKVVYNLLVNLSENNTKYTPCNLLKKEALQ